MGETDSQNVGVEAPKTLTKRQLKILISNRLSEDTVRNGDFFKLATLYASLLEPAPKRQARGKEKSAALTPEEEFHSLVLKLEKGEA